MKKQHIILSLIIAILVFIVWIILSDSMNRNQNVEKSDLEIVRNWFPDLSGIQSVQLYAKKSGDEKSLIPGPTTVYTEGIIKISKENTEKYLALYDDWEVAEIGEIHSDLELPNCEWYYSENFETEIKPSYYYGKVFLEKTGYLFFYMVIE